MAETPRDPGLAELRRYLDAERALLDRHREQLRRVEAEGAPNGWAALDRRLAALNEVMAEANALLRRHAAEWAADDRLAEAPDSLGAAVDRYRDRFGGEALPHLFGLPGDGERVAVAMLDYAVATGRPLAGWQIMAALGIREPPPGAVI